MYNKSLQYLSLKDFNYIYVDYKAFEIKLDY